MKISVRIYSIVVKTQNLKTSVVQSGEIGSLLLHCSLYVEELKATFVRQCGLCFFSTWLRFIESEIPVHGTGYCRVR